MLIIQCKNKINGELIATPNDKLGRADAKLVSLLSRLNRVVKDIDVLYTSDDTFKVNKSILSFKWKDKDELIKIVRLNSFNVE